MKEEATEEAVVTKGRDQYGEFEKHEYPDGRTVTKRMMGGIEIIQYGSTNNR